MEHSHIFHATCFPGTQGIWWGGLGGGGGGDNVRWNIHTYSMLHVLQGRRASGGVGWVGGGGGGGDNVRWNIHTYSILHICQGTQNIPV